jgi:hypothetical protein
MEIIAITGILGVLAVIALAVIRPWEPGRLAAIHLLWEYRPQHGGGLTGPEVTAISPMQRWEYGIVGVDVCPRCGGPLASAPCSTCGWERPAGHAPWETDSGSLIFGTSGLLGWNSGSGGPPDGRSGPPEPPPPPAPAPAPTDGSAEPPGAWRAAYDQLAPAEPPPPLPRWATDGGEWPVGSMMLPRLGAGIRCQHGGPWEPPPPEPELPPSGDWAPGTGPPEGDPEPGRCADCRMLVDPWMVHDCPGPPDTWGTWQPSRLATPHDRALAAETAAALADLNTDAALFIDRMTSDRRAYLWQLRRAFLVSRGLAYE